MLIKIKTCLQPDMTGLTLYGCRLIDTANFSIKEVDYDFGITISHKKIIERDANVTDFAVNTGTYLSRTSTRFLIEPDKYGAYTFYGIAAKKSDLIVQNNRAGL